MMKVHNFFRKTFLVATIFCCVSFSAMSQAHDRYLVAHESDSLVILNEFHWLQDAIEFAYTHAGGIINGSSYPNNCYVGTPTSDRYFIWVTENDTDMSDKGNKGGTNGIPVLVHGKDTNASIPEGLNIKLASWNVTNPANAFVITQKSMALHFFSWGIGGKLTTENIVLSGMGYDRETVVNLGYLGMNTLLGNGGVRNLAEHNMLKGAVIQNCFNFWCCEASHILNMYDGSIIQNCNGAAVYSNNFNMYDGALIRNCTGYNGAVYTNSGITNIYGGEIIDNDCSGIAHLGGVLTISGGVIARNRTSDSGGGIKISQNGNDCSKFYMTGGYIMDNEASFGGGISVECETAIYISGGEISGNKANGSIVYYLNDAGIDIDNMSPDDFLQTFFGTFDFSSVDDMLAFIEVDAGDVNNYTALDLIIMIYEKFIPGSFEAFGSGGGVLLPPYATLNMTGGVIKNNTASTCGGGIYTYNCNYKNPMLAYNNISIANKDSVYNNTAGQGATAPNIPAWDKNFDISLLTNHQINYRPTPPTLDTICFTDSVTLAVTVKDGGQNPVYQWILNGVEITGANDSVFKYKSSGRDTIQCKVYPDTACGDEVYSKIMVIEMLDSLALEQPDNNEVCSGETVPNITFSGVYDYVRWGVTTGNGLTIGMPANSGTGDISAFTTTNSGEITITVTPVSGECEGVSKTFTITVTPKVKTKATIRLR